MKFTLIYSEEQDKADLIERLILKPWTGYCLKNWLSENHTQTYAPEHKVKRLLDRCGTLLLRDVPQAKRDTLTNYKEMMIGSRELSASACPEAIADMIESGCADLTRLTPDDRLRYQLLTEQLNGQYSQKSEAKRRTSTRFDRLEAIRKRYPGCRLETCRVDVDGCFVCHGRKYRVDSTHGKYAPHKTRYGDQYDMDRIIGICQTDGKISFADQDGYPMEDDLITVMEAME